ncbi:hypothetical protein F5B22DRAFT_647999 [Xylaria bambusicola]|uniref:uncharacterized protein n=1 Tax=Xylaria bambusicola TaxID=326684 RepID=UPI002008BA90|nr:uncharacterized protein F5B22DRAFT_647999 [Xylaria bambusicola]KAI0513187.1 hypothetical protein F5B22DRAFT_647999 [Xylaria bambusicola]
MAARRNDHDGVIRRTAILQVRIRAFSTATKEDLLVRAALRDGATAGDILQTAIDHRPENPTNVAPMNPNPTFEELVEHIIRESLSYLDNEFRDLLLLDAGLRDDATAGDIIQTAIDL